MPLKRRSSSEIRCHRASSWIVKAKKLSATDFDGRFIFYWIAFNALYGQPRYLEIGKSKGEEQDFQSFLVLVQRLDRTKSISHALDRLEDHCQKILEDKFLSDECWKYWDSQGLLSAEERLREGRADALYGKRLNQLFHRMYVLRKQLFHGCSTDGGSKNREMLKSAVVMMEQLIPLFRDVVQTCGAGLALLERLPYRPSL
jgi:hypothetical protein